MPPRTGSRLTSPIGSAARPSGQALRRLFEYVLRKARRSDDSLQLGSHQVGPRRFEPPPPAERRDLASGNLRINAVGFQDHVRDKAVAATGNMMEDPLI